MLKMNENGADIFENDTVNVSVSFSPVLTNSLQDTQIKADRQSLAENESEVHGFCPTCGGEMCPHDICSANWCGMDHHCLECADREWREIEVEDNAKYYEGDFE